MSTAASRIPRASVSGLRSRIPHARESIGVSSVKSGVLSVRPANELVSAQRGEAVKAPKILCKRPSQKSMEKRRLPDELSGRPRVYGHNRQVELLYRHVSGIFDKYFSADLKNSFFPPGVSQLISSSEFRPSVNRDSLCSNASASNGSRIPVHRISSIISSADLCDESDVPGSVSLCKGIDILSRLLSESGEVIESLSDFCILYSAFCLCVGGLSSIKSSLVFCEKFVGKFGRCRVEECHILFSVLVGLGCEDPSFHIANDRFSEVLPSVVNVLKVLGSLDESLKLRLENGSNHSDPHLSDICRRSLCICSSAEVRSSEIAKFEFSGSEDIVSESVSRLVSLLRSNRLPSDPLSTVVDLISCMSRFHSSPIILCRCSECIESLLPSAKCPPIDALSSLLLLCFSIIGGSQFVDGGGESFAAIDSIQRLVDVCISHCGPIESMRALSCVISQSDGNSLSLAVDRFKSVSSMTDGSCTRPFSRVVDSFRPNIFKSAPSNEESSSSTSISKLELSINRLNDSASVLEEISSLVDSSPDGFYSEYPNYLRRVLQCSWTARHRICARGLDASLGAEVIRNLDLDDLPSSSELLSSLKSLSSECQSICLEQANE